MEKPKKIMYLMIFVYTVGWSIISLLRYYSFNARYFDLGVSMGYITYSVEGLTLSKFVQIFALKPIVYLRSYSIRFQLSRASGFSVILLGFRRLPRIYDIA